MVYLHVIISKKRSMIATDAPSRKKIIDIKASTFRGLSIMAASQGTNLKNFIEHRLDELAESYNDSMIYSALSKSAPKGHEVLTPEEQTAFETKYGL